MVDGSAGSGCCGCEWCVTLLTRAVTMQVCPLQHSLFAGRSKRSNDTVRPLGLDPLDPVIASKKRTAGRRKSQTNGAEVSDGVGVL